MFNYSYDIKLKSETDLSSALADAIKIGIGPVEISALIDGTPLWEMNGEQLENLRDTFIDSGRKVALITLDGKHGFDELKKFFRAAHLIGCENVRIDSLLSRDQISETAHIADSFGIRPLLENAADSPLKTDNDLDNIYRALDEYHPGIIYNPFEFVKLSHHPFFHMFYTSHLKNDIVFLRINDGLYSGGFTPLAHGNCEIKELISILLARSYRGYFSISDYSACGDAGKSTLADFKNLAKYM